MATFHLDLVAPDRLTFSGEVEQVDIPGLEGDFGVLANHAPTVALLRPGILRIFAENAQQEFVVLGGFAEVAADGALTILADVATPIDQFDVAALHARIEDMEKNIKTIDDGSLLDREILMLDHYKAINKHLEGTAMH
jgi:F-type H+-transporting ATPase subunit epsilon